MNELMASGQNYLNSDHTSSYLWQICVQPFLVHGYLAAINSAFPAREVLVFGDSILADRHATISARARDPDFRQDVDRGLSGDGVTNFRLGRVVLQVSQANHGPEMPILGHS